MAEVDSRALGGAEELSQPIDHRLPEFLRVAVFGNIEGKQADVPRAQRVGDLQRVPELLQMGREILVDSGGGADGPCGQARAVQLSANFPRRGQRQVGDVNSVRVANFQSVQAVSAHGRNLPVHRRARLVGEGVKPGHVHFSSSFVSCFSQL